MSGDPNLSGFLSTASWGYADPANPVTVTLTTQDTPIVFTDGVLDTEDTQGPGTFDPDTGLYTVEKSGFYQFFASGRIAAAQDDPAIQRMGLFISGESDVRLPGFRDEALGATIVRMTTFGVVELVGGQEVGLAFASDTASDSAIVSEVRFMLQRVHAALGMGF